MTAPAQPEQPLRQRIDATIRPRMLIGLQDAELYDEPGRERIEEWADSITSWVLAVVQPDLDARDAENDRLNAALEVITAQHAKAVTARNKAQQRAKISDDIQRAEKALFDTAIRDLGGEPVIVQNLYAQLSMRGQQWQNAQTALAARDAEIQKLRAQLAEAAQEASTVLDAVAALADRWDNALAVDKPYARALRDALTAASRPTT